jgi:hypothetical protein
METLSQAVERLRSAGYESDFRAENGWMRATASGFLHEPESLAIEEVVRFEGESDPGDEAALFALRSTVDDSRGTYVVTYGPQVDARDADVVGRLQDYRRR